jgi:FG-GAP-like repeat
MDDFDGDTIADLVIVGGAVSVALGRGDGTFRRPVLSFVVSGLSMVVGEFNGDGRKDLAATGFNGVSIVLGWGDGSFQVAWNYELGASAFLDSTTRPIEGSTVALGEFNGDGIKDLAVANSLGRISVLLGYGDGSFQWAFDYYNLTQGSTSIAVGEFNRDGIQDLVVDVYGGVRILLGNGNGTFQPPLNFPVETPGSIAVGYFNGDGFQYLAAVGSGASRISGADWKWRQDIPGAIVL